MPSDKYLMTGLVARLVSDEELIINKGSYDGVRKNMIFDVLDPRTQDVTDPETGEDLGSFDRVLARVRVTDVLERMSMARLTPGRTGFGGVLSNVARAMSGYQGPARLTSDTWLEGVRQGYPVGHVGGFWNPIETPEPQSSE